MNNYRGMTLKQMDDVLNVMHKIYPYENDKTRLCDAYDEKSNGFCNVEIRTQDEETGVWIHLSKEVEPSWR